jgi:hypothetical protein
MPVMVKSELNHKEIVKSILFEKEVLDEMDSDLLEIVKNIFNGRNINTSYVEN